MRWVASAGLVLCAASALIYGATRSDWLGGVLARITVAMSVLPEEFPLLLTVFLAMGAWRISRAGVLTRRMPALEAIGAASLLAVDKTGTLTENRMQVVAIETADERVDIQVGVTLSPVAEPVLLSALAASEHQPFAPMERGIHATAQLVIPEKARQLQEMQLVREYDLTPELLAVTHVWQSHEQRSVVVAVKGAPETVLELCRLDPATQSALMERVNANAGRGLRILGVARGNADANALPESPRGFDLTFAGFVCSPTRYDQMFPPPSRNVSRRASVSS